MYWNDDFNPAWLFIYVFIYCLFLVSIFGAHQIHKAMYVPAPEEEPQNVMFDTKPESRSDKSSWRTKRQVVCDKGRVCLVAAMFGAIYFSLFRVRLLEL